MSESDDSSSFGATGKTRKTKEACHLRHAVYLKTNKREIQKRPSGTTGATEKTRRVKKTYDEWTSRDANTRARSQMRERGGEEGKEGGKERAWQGGNKERTGKEKSAGYWKRQIPLAKREKRTVGGRSNQYTTVKRPEDRGSSNEEN